ncbi:MAG: UDP-N-acetylmuramoyl-L-alanine--D-glutamate ligase, partial [Alphaproteobacteria bacterium]|nr:UDP-N-acetylmuramoyl-L-alanine--D-glutamate ligase [Alphaproteobacteria bacterium]
ALVLSPGIPYKFPQPHRLVRMAEMTGVPVIGDMELFARAVQAMPERSRPKVIGITGTNGKSTTTALIGHILKEAGRDVRVGGNIGTGVLDLAPLHSNAVYVLELSSYQLDLVKSLHCNVAVMLNLSPDHLDRHGGMDGYQAAKMRIFQNQTPQDVAVIGFDDIYTQSMAIGLGGSGVQKVTQISSTYTLGKGVSAVEGRLYDNMSGKAEFIGKLEDCPALQGRHNFQNAAAAYAACRAIGLDPATIMAGLKTFPGLAHRMENVGALEGVRFVNDAKATNAQAAEQALRSFRNIYWIAGGVAKAEGIAPLAACFPNVTKAYLIGQAEETFAAALQGKVPAQVCGTLERAVDAAFRDARASGDPSPVILLSPACASFDQFKDYEHRGDVFRDLVSAMMPAPIKESA